MVLVSATFRGDGLFARALRSSAWTASGFAASQIVRLVSNLVLTRLLFPEAFGMMALVTVVMIGLTNFSDVGIGPAILQSRRGDDRDFLDTAWTAQIVRGALLWLATCALALPIARFYDAPELAQILPVSGLSLLIGGFNPTRIETANRHLLLGKLTLLDLISQVVGVAAMVAFAFATGSVWSLVVGGLVGTAAKLVLTCAFLPGPPNRLRWDPSAGQEIIGFGKWIFLSTVCGFLLAQGDRVILGKYLSLEWLGVYNIGYFLASAPLSLGGAIVGRVMIPLYRESTATDGANHRKTRLMRRILTAGLLASLLGMAFLGVPLVEALYGPEYASAGPILVLVACTQIPFVIGMTYDRAALAAGDSRRFFYVIAARAGLFTASFLVGAETGGLVGALLGQGLALVLAYPLTAWLAWVYGQWDPLHDVVFGAVGTGLAAVAIWSNRDALAVLTAAAGFG